MRRRQHCCEGAQNRNEHQTCGSRKTSGERDSARLSQSSNAATPVDLQRPLKEGYAIADTCRKQHGYLEKNKDIIHLPRVYEPWSTVAAITPSQHSAECANILNCCVDVNAIVDQKPLPCCLKHMCEPESCDTQTSKQGKSVIWSEKCKQCSKQSRPPVWLQQGAQPSAYG